ncbi:D-alanyl-D-alanine carboxypeptidase [Patescibacteria group bacterium]|nr:D-alanyl-D-alanine carboxypeptidase [Patescibacteria group bacterium]MBU1499315.1 D-alanyl-D-alanine carboxypeptidase [Patescibacteria group bacterium]
MKLSSELKNFLKKFKINLILNAVFLSLIPLNIDLIQTKPLVRPVNYQFLPASDYPVNTAKIPAPALTARGVIVIDADSKAILYQQNPDLKLLPASTTKIMTALIALENYSLNEVITISPIDTEPVTMGLQTNEKITVENLLYGLLVGSANDAALALARHFPTGEAGFIAAMNLKAKSLHLLNTQFTNPVGFDNFGQYTTVHDLSLLTAEAMQSAFFKRLVSTISITVTDVDHTVSHELTSLNLLLGQVSGLSGVKTGFTQLAGECLITFVQRQNHQIITIVLGSHDRFGDTNQLIDWVFVNFSWQELSPATHY